jgi:hypothetical protein
MPATAAEERYSAKQLRAESAKHGAPVSGRLVTDWVEKGLLDRPEVRGLGRGKGTSATWDQNQLRLFVSLLKQRQHARRAATLCNIPVGLWLMFGDTYVPLRQVRRAMGTWTSAYAVVGKGRAETSARELLEQVAHPDATEGDRDRFELIITRAAQAQLPDLHELDKVAAKVIDPHRSGLARGPMGMIHAENVLQTLRLRIAGLQSIDAPDEIYQGAREIYRIAGSKRNPLPLAEAAQANLVISWTGRNTSSKGQAQAFTQACLDLTMLIGLTIGNNGTPTPS